MPLGEIPGMADRVFRTLADHVELALEGQIIAQLRAAAHEQLAHEGFAGAGRGAQRTVVGGQVAPAENLLSFLGDDLLDQGLAVPALAGIGRQRQHAEPVLAGGGQLDAQLDGHRLQKVVGNLYQDAGAVPGIGLSAAGTAVIEIQQNLESAADDVVGALALHVGQEADAAGVVLEGRVIEALSAWWLRANMFGELVF